MKFKSKIDWWFHLTVVFSLLGTMLPIVLGIVYGITSALIVGIVVMLIVEGVLVLPIYFNTYYILEESALHIRLGLCMNKRISYNNIKNMYETKNPLASAGMSLDRIFIQYSEGEVLISPKNKQEFIKQLNERMA